MATALDKAGWDILLDKLSQLDALPEVLLIGMEATARESREPLSRGLCSETINSACYIRDKRISFTSVKGGSPRRIASMP